MKVIRVENGVVSVLGSTPADVNHLRDFQWAMGCEFCTAKEGSAVADLPTLTRKGTAENHGDNTDAEWTCRWATEDDARCKTLVVPEQ